MKTYNVHFNDDQDSNDMGFELTKQECIDWIRSYNGTDHSYFKDYKGGIVSVVDAKGSEVYSRIVK